MSNPDNKTAIQSLQFQQMFSGGYVSLATSALLAFILALMQLQVIAPTIVFSWLSVVVLLTIFRTALVIHYLRSPKEVGSINHSRMVNFRIGVIVSGVVWGSASFLMFPVNNPEHQMFLIFILSGLTAGALASYSADLVCAIGFSVSVLVPLAIRMFAAGSGLSVAMGTVITIYLGFMILSGRKSNQHIRDNIVLRLEASSRENAMRTSEEQYRLLLWHSPVGLIHYDANLVITYCNDRFAEILNSSADRIVGMDMKTLKDQSVLPTLRKALEGEIVLYEGHYLATTSDADRWIAMTCAPSRDSNEKAVGGIGIVQDITERKLAEEGIRYLAFYDSLTKVPNRRLLNDRLDQAIVASKRNSRYGALMFLDLDNFKPLNDTHGHKVGDLLLIEAARRIGSCIRETDTVARFGGDEFVVLLRELKEDQSESKTHAGRVAEKIRASMSEPYRLVVKHDGSAEVIVEHQCTSSIGVVVFDHQASREDILRRADMAMYEAKEAGRNCVVFNKQGSSKTGIDNKGSTILHLIWHDSYACGESTIDDEHRKLFEFANNLIDSAFTRNENPQQLDSDLEKLLAHVVQHFADEEAILARYHYNDLDVHAHDHKVLIEHALKLRDSALAGGVTIGELVNFLAEEVVAQHLLKTDHKFFPLFTTS
jgi:diguanylate cyclase (GGDEF)-like protein/hemerythrin-like metal-binding protein/PAS domain S-box-containing protein